MNYDYCFKFILIGDSGVGKSCLLLNLLEQRFREEHQVNIGVEFGSITFTIDNKVVKLQIWDTAGQDMFRSIIRSYYKGAVAAILCYDIACERSYQNCESWLYEARQNANEKICITLVGNKLDLAEKRAVPLEEAQEWAAHQNAFFYEASAKTGERVEEIFIETAKYLCAKIENELGPMSSTGHLNGTQEEGLVLAKEKIKPFDWQERKSSCCS